MKTVLLLVAALAWGIQANSRLESNRPAQYVQTLASYEEGFFQGFNGFSNDDDNYFPSSRAIGYYRDVTYLMKIINRWMRYNLDVLSKIVSGIKLLTKAFKAFKVTPKEDKNLDTEMEISEIDSTTTPEATTPETTTPEATTPEATTPETTTPSISYEMVLYVGTPNEKSVIDIYDWEKDTQSFQKRSSNKMVDPVIWIVPDPTSNILIAVDYQQKENQVLEVLDLNGGVGKPTTKKANIFKNTTYRYATLDSSGKFLIATSLREVSAMELLEDGSLNVVDTYDNRIDSLNPTPGRVTFHPVANGVFAVVYRYQVKFFRFDITTKKITPLSKVANIESAFDMVFSDDGQYMYLCNTKNKLYTFKITVDINTNDVTSVEDNGVVDILKGEKSLTNAYMAISPSAELIYVVIKARNKVAIFSNNPPSGKQTLIGLQDIGGENFQSVALSPDGAQLLAADPVAGIFVLNTYDNGTLVKAFTIEESFQPYLLRYVYQKVVKTVQ